MAIVNENAGLLINESDLEVDFENKLVVPTAVSPNDDGINDVFFIRIRISFISDLGGKCHH